MLLIIVQGLWHTLLGFAFYYPLFMSYLWMIGAVLFYWRIERHDPPPEHPNHLHPSPAVSVLIPCFNEEDNAEETLRYALELDYPDFEVIAINDGSKDRTAEVLDRLAQQHPQLRVVHLARNQGKAMALQAGSLLARNEILLCIDGDALLDAQAAHWMVRHFVSNPEVAAVTGNPRIRNRSTLLGRVQVGEFSSIVGMIKRAQRSFGRLFTVSGVITAFRKSAIHQVGYWSDDVLTEDIDITWKLQRAGWDVRFETNALVWILMPETLKGLWNQRLRWATGGAQVLIRNAHALRMPSQNHLWPLLLELLFSLLWSYGMLLITCVWLLSLLHPAVTGPVSSPLIPEEGGVLLAATCLAQFALAKAMDSRYDQGLGKNYYWMIWYPFIFWLINILATIRAFPRAWRWNSGQRARWISPDRGVKPEDRL